MDDEQLTPVWKALSDPTRRGILDLLKERPRTTGELSENFDQLSRFAVMKHLSVLTEAGLVVVRPRGRERWNYLNAIPLQQIAERWLRPYEAHWASNLLNLKRYAERGQGVAESMADLSPKMEAIQIEQEVVIEADPGRVFDGLLDVDAWWSYRYSADSKGLVLEPRVGGRFYEFFDEADEGALYGVVTLFKRPEQIVISGSIGMSEAIIGLVQFELEAHERGTLLKLSHQATGPISQATREGYTVGWKALLGENLKQFVELGVPFQRQGE